MKNLFSSIATKANTISINSDSKNHVLGKCAACGLPVAILSSSFIFATGAGTGTGTGTGGGESSKAFTEIAKTLTGLFKDIFKAISGALTVVSLAIIGICLLLRIISKDPRKVEEATSWAKRVVITWAIFMILGLLVTFMSDFGGDNGVKDSDLEGQFE